MLPGLKVYNTGVLFNPRRNCRGGDVCVKICLEGDKKTVVYCLRGPWFCQGSSEVLCSDWTMGPLRDLSGMGPVLG